MGTKRTSTKGPAGQRKRGPLNLTIAQQGRVRAAMRRLHAQHGSDKAVAALCVTAGAPITPATICRVRNDTPPGRTVARALARVLGIEVAVLLDGTGVRA